MGASNSNLVDDVNKVLLAEQESNHEVGRCGSTDVRSRGPSLIARHKNDERNEVSHEDRCEGLAVVGKEDV